MTSPVVTVRPDTPIKEVARLLLTHHISGVPV
ncbi:MAG: CBS domain-containing protein, partial [Armatimonadota bacterium]|nr:CBS domain-containing protein [Armatimonadota bacterium]